MGRAMLPENRRKMLLKRVAAYLEDQINELEQSHTVPGTGAVDDDAVADEISMVRQWVAELRAHSAACRSSEGK